MWILPLINASFVADAVAPSHTAPTPTGNSRPLSARPTADPTYPGPRFPGGPDSLRALMYRSQRLAPAGTTGLVLVQVEHKANGQPPALKLLPPTDADNSALKKAGATALDYLKSNLPAWLPGTAPEKSPPASSYLPLVFGRPAATLPYAYADQGPRFDGLAQFAFPSATTNTRYQALVSDSAKLAEFNTSQTGMQAALQARTRYPPAAMRAGHQGRVMLYFEVAENGAIEHAQVASNTAGPVLAEEVIRVVRQLPTASSPAQLRGQPVRVYYVIPLTFKIL